MSKCNSGLFGGTIGIKSSLSSTLKYTNIIRTRANQLDLREHPRKKNLTTKQRKEIHDKIANRTATRLEFKLYDSQKRFAERRKTGINRFWNAEQVRVLSNKKTTRPWNDEQRTAIAHGDRPILKATFHDFRRNK